MHSALEQEVQLVGCKGRQLESVEPVLLGRHLGASSPVPCLHFMWLPHEEATPQTPQSRERLNCMNARAFRSVYL